MKKAAKNKLLLILSILLFAVASIAQAKDCPSCKAVDLPNLSMVCPNCGANIYDYAFESKGTDRSALIIKLFYTGDNPNKLPPYAKLFLNGKYYGNIEMIEKQLRSEESLKGWKDGLGDKFTAFYEKEFRDIPLGQVKVEVEMRFHRFLGLAKSIKRAVFPYVKFTGKNKRVIEHYFDSAGDFTVTDVKKKKKQKEEKLKLPIPKDTKFKTATGTVKIDMGLF